jgi:hypothetical protein
MMVVPSSPLITHDSLGVSDIYNNNNNNNNKSGIVRENQESSQQQMLKSDVGMLPTKNSNFLVRGTDRRQRNRMSRVSRHSAPFPTTSCFQRIVYDTLSQNICWIMEDHTVVSCRRRDEKVLSSEFLCVCETITVLGVYVRTECSLHKRPPGSGF